MQRALSMTCLLQQDNVDFPHRAVFQHGGPKRLPLLQSGCQPPLQVALRLLSRLDGKQEDLNEPFEAWASGSVCVMLGTAGSTHMETQSHRSWDEEKVHYSFFFGASKALIWRPEYCEPMYNQRFFNQVPISVGCC